MSACSSSGESVAPTLPTTTTIAQQECDDVARDAVGPLQVFIDDYAEFTIEEWNALEPPPNVEQAQRDMVAVAQAAVDRGCNPARMEEMLGESIAGLSGDGVVGRSIAAALRGDGPLLGPPAPVPLTTVPRDDEPSVAQVEPGDDLVALLATIGAGSTIEFAAGTYELEEAILVAVDVTFSGAGIDDTVISSTAEGVAVAFVGPGGFSIEDMTIEHSGNLDASVVLAIQGPLNLARTELRGGSVSADSEGGGHGLVLAYDPIPGFPERTAAERAGAVTISESRFVDNQAAGILMTGDATPTISASLIEGNAGCGVCFTSKSGGTVETSTVTGNQIGVQVTGEATPTIVDSDVENNMAVGISVDGEATVAVANARFTGNADVGVQATGAVDITVDQSTFTEHGVGVLIAGTSTGSITNNTFETHEVGVQAGAEAIVEVRDNVVRGSAAAGINFADESSGVITGNEVVDAPQVAIQVIGNGTPEISGNTISTEGNVGISTLDDASPSISENDIRDRLVGIQAGGTSEPAIVGNTITTPGGVGVTVLDESSATVSGNDVSNRDIGIQVSGSANPSIVDNDVIDSITVGILFGEQATGNATGNRVTSPDAAGIVVGGDAAPIIERNSMAANAIGLIYREQGGGEARRNIIEDHTIGIQIVDAASPFIFLNELYRSVDAGITVGGTSTARIEQNRFERNGNISVNVAEQAAPEIAGNFLLGQGVYGIVFRDDSAGQARDNRIVEFVYGIQIDGSAAPAIIGNLLDKVALTNITYSGSSGGTVSGNTCGTALTSGITIADNAAPVVGDNNCTVGSGSGISLG